MAKLPPPDELQYDPWAFRLVLSEVERFAWPFLGTLGAALGDSWAGEHYRMIGERRIAKVDRAEEHQRRQEAEQRKAREREALREKETQAHRDRKAEREPRRLAFLAALGTLAPIERLERLLDPSLEFPIDAVPAGMIPLDPQILAQLNASTRRHLLQKIDLRPGAWRTLRKCLEALDPPSEGDRS